MSDILKHRKLELLRMKKEMMDSLPHLYGFDWYPWQKEFIDEASYYEYNFLVCCNQVGKTTSLMAKLVKLATDKELQQELWVKEPRMFLYFLPSQNLHNDAFNDKWSKEILPQGRYKDHPVYGWKPIKEGMAYKGIVFKSGVTIRFMTYGQNVHNLQSITAHVVAFDEEPPVEILPEVQTRTASIEVSDGNKSKAWGGLKLFAFTATKSQKYFYEVMEERGKYERHPVTDGNVWKRQVSLYDCQFTVSGKPTKYTDEFIKKRIDEMPSEAEVKRRIMGRFQPTEGLVYQSFNQSRNVKQGKPVISNNYLNYGGLDYGSGGNAHPSSICIVSVLPDYSHGFVRKIWKGKGENTTCDDVIQIYMEMIKDINITQTFYDWGAKDLHTFATRYGLTIEKAQKDHKIGRETLNSLFKREMLDIYEDVGDSHFLIQELTTLTEIGLKTKKRFAVDDCIDALRYAVTRIPWDYSLTDAAVIENVSTNDKRDRQGNLIFKEEDSDFTDCDDEMMEWGEYYEL